MSSKPNFISQLTGSLALLLTIGAAAIAQTAGSAPNNNPFSPNPASKAPIVNSDTPVRVSTARNVPVINNAVALSPSRDGDQIAGNTTIMAAPTGTGRRDPTSEYRIGVGDMIRVDILNVTAGPRYFKIGSDGKINYQLAGRLIDTLGMTTAELEFAIAASIKLYSRPSVSVQVREFASHIVSVRGAVEFPGDHQIQRDALPFFVIRAKVIPNSSARSVRITRASAAAGREYRLTDAGLSDMIIYPGDLIEFL